MSSGPKVFRDPVHNTILLERDDPTDQLLLRLIDSRELQRLRRIRQLGLAHFVFHGAEHSRFGHSLGAMWVARRMLDQLSRDASLSSSERTPVLAAALLHDIGHGPFSHNAEALMTLPHEEWSCRMLLDPETEVHSILSEWDPRLPEEVARYVRGEARPRTLGHIVSGQLDCDRLDYILRDRWALGVDVTYDLSRLMGMMGQDRMEDRLVIDARGHDVVESYLLARHHLYRNVYHHKTTRAAGAMLGAAFHRAEALARGGVPMELPPGGFARMIRREVLTLSEYLALDDSDLWGLLKVFSRSEDPVLARLGRGLLERRLYKGVWVSHLPPDERDRRRLRAEELLRGAEYDPSYSLLEDRAADQAYRPYSAHLGSEGIFIRWPSGNREISESSGTVRALFEVSEDVRWFVPAELRPAVQKLVGAGPGPR